MARSSRTEDNYICDHCGRDVYGLQTIGTMKVCGRADCLRAALTAADGGAQVRHLAGELRGLKRLRVIRHLAACERGQAVLRSLREAVERLCVLGWPERPQPALVEAVLERFRADQPPPYSKR